MNWKLALNKIFYQRITEPLHLNILSILVKTFGSYRMKITWDLIIRQHYAYGILKAADNALSNNIDTVTVCEFGVGFGAGLKRLGQITKNITKITGIKFKIYGFDIITGMPSKPDYKDLPNIFRKGTYKTNVEHLNSIMPKNARLIQGDVNETIDKFIDELPESEPIGFAALDLDLYYGTRAALRVFENKPEKYLPYVVLYLDDIVTPEMSSKTGELRAVKEFNDENEYRAIEEYPFLENERIFKNANWIKQMRFLQILDHPVRNKL